PLRRTCSSGALSATRFPAGASASASSGLWPIAVGRRCCRFAGICLKSTHNHGRPHRTQPRSKSNRPGSVPYAAARWLSSRDLQRSRFYWSLSSGRNTFILLDNTIFTELSAPLLIRTLPVYLATVNKCWKLVEGLTDHPQKHDSFCRDVPFGRFLLLPRLQSPLSWQRRSIQST